MSPTLLSELLKLPESERLELGQELLDSIGADSDELGPTGDEIEEMHWRLAEHHASGPIAVSRQPRPHRSS